MVDIAGRNHKPLSFPANIHSQKPLRNIPRRTRTAYPVVTIWNAASEAVGEFPTNRFGIDGIILGPQPEALPSPRHEFLQLNKSLPLHRRRQFQPKNRTEAPKKKPLAVHSSAKAVVEEGGIRRSKDERRGVVGGRGGGNGKARKGQWGELWVGRHGEPAQKRKRAKVERKRGAC
eukprot:c30438_g1_i1 orf=3-524(-)